MGGSNRSPLICQECYEERDLKGPFASRLEWLALVGICDVCLERKICAHVSLSEAMSLTRRERLIIKSISVGIGIAALLLVAVIFSR